MARDGTEDDLTLPWPDEEEGEGEQSTEEAQEEEPRVLTVSEVNRMARQALESIRVTVQGEVSRLHTGYAYYVYFDLRDSDASLPAILTQPQLKSLDFKLEEGASVVVTGTLTLFEKQGKYQIRVAEIRQFGEGDIRRRIEELKRKLHAEGLFEEARKKRLPRYPERIGVVTSPRGAAVRDIVVTIGRRFPAAHVFVRGARVQGAGAEAQVCAALEFFDAHWPVEVVILARGGGSLQDLEPFNSEAVARAIVAMGIPVVTGIGHEPDVTIADLVADLRASTPTGAAETVAPDRAEVAQSLSKSKAALERLVRMEVNSLASRLSGARKRPLYRGYDFLLGPLMQRWERMAESLPDSPRRGLAEGRRRVEAVIGRPVFRRPEFAVGGYRAAMGRAGVSVGAAALRDSERRRKDLERRAAKLEALSPTAVLSRGYSITFNKGTGGIVRSADDVEDGTPLSIRLARGALEAEVTGRGEESGG